MKLFLIFLILIIKIFKFSIGESKYLFSYRIFIEKLSVFRKLKVK